MSRNKCCDSGIPPTVQSLLRSAFLHLEASQSESSISSTATADSLVGAGRTLGKLYAFLGRKLEVVINRNMARLGYGPEACKSRLLKNRKKNLSCDIHFPGSDYLMQIPNSKEDRQARKEIRKILKYTRSEIIDNQYLAFEVIVDLAAFDSYMRSLLFSEDAPRIIALENIRATQDLLKSPLVVPSRKALISLHEVDIHNAGKKAALLYRSIWKHARVSGERDRQSQWKELALFLDTVAELIQHIIRSQACSFLALRHLGKAPLFSGFESFFQNEAYPLELRKQYDSIPVALVDAFRYLLDEVSNHAIEWQSFGWLLLVFALYSRGLGARLVLAREIACRSWKHLPPHIQRSLVDFGPQSRMPDND